MRYIIIVIAVIFTTVLGNARIDITSKASGEIVPIYSLSGVIVEYEQVGHLDPLNAFIVLKMTGKLEANICSHNDFSMLTNFRSLDPVSEVEQYDIKITPTTIATGDVEIGEEFCTQQSQSEWFSVNMRLSVNSWDPAKDEKKWQYSIRDANKVHGTMDLTYHKRNGWSMSFTKL